MSTLYVDRDEASRLLKVSTRTIDRYARKFRLKIKRDGRRIYFRRNDLDAVIKEHLGQFVEHVDFNLDQDPAMTPVATPHVSYEKQEASHLSSPQDEPMASDEKIYKTLYLETKQELKERQDRLEAATYRVGQLETQLKNMVPLLDYSQKEKELTEAQIALEQKAAESSQAVRRIEHKLRVERIAKWAYLSLVGALLVVEPLLFLFWIFS